MLNDEQVRMDSKLKDELIKMVSNWVEQLDTDEPNQNIDSETRNTNVDPISLYTYGTKFRYKRRS